MDIVSGSEWDRTMSAPRDLTREKLRGEEVEMTRRPLRWASWTAAWPTEEEPPQMRTSVCGWGFGVEVEVEKDIDEEEEQEGDGEEDEYVRNMGDVVVGEELHLFLGGSHE